MSHFYGSMQGSRGEVTRQGGKNGGISAHVRGWDFGVRVEMRHIDGRDVAVIVLTGGSIDKDMPKIIGTFQVEDLRD